MRVVCKYTEKGDGIENEDAVGFADNAFWVIDGATDLFKKKIFGTVDDVAFYVRELNVSLLSNMNDNESLQEILKKTILQVNEKLGLDTQQYNSFELPSFAILVARCIENVCEYYVLGDCSLLVYENGDVNKITDKRLVEFSLRNREGLKKLLRSEKYSQSEETAIYGSTRKLMNTPDGYWIGSADCGGLDHAVCGKITISKGALLLAYSDGLLEAFDLFGINNEDETIFNENRLKNVVCELRECQSGDSERKVARVRKKDDLTYIMVRC